jgi:hypothetical protein
MRVSILLLALLPVLMIASPDTRSAAAPAEGSVDPAVDHQALPETFAYVPGLAADDATGEVPGPAIYTLDASFVRFPAFNYEIVGFEVVTAPADFFYSHAIAQQEDEPFTHTGSVDFFIDGPGGPYTGSAPAVDGRAEFLQQFPGPGPITIEIVDGAGYRGDGLPVAGDFGDFVPPSLNDFPSPAPGRVFPLDFVFTVNVFGGNCPAYVTTLEITAFDDARLRFFQPDTGDLNEGILWPNSEGGWDFYVNNQAHPESYVGGFTPGWDTMSGELVWNNQCRQFFRVD